MDSSLNEAADALATSYVLDRFAECDIGERIEGMPNTVFCREHEARVIDGDLTKCNAWVTQHETFADAFVWLLAERMNRDIVMEVWDE